MRALILVLAAASLLMVAGFGLSRAIAGDSVLGGVEVFEVEIGGLSPAELTVALADVDSSIRAQQAVFEIRDSATSLTPDQVGLRLDLEAMAAEALSVGRQGNISDQFRWWLGHLGAGETLPIIASLDETAAEAVLNVWDTDFVGNPPFAGAVRFEGVTPVAEYPADGEQIDRSVAASIILDTLTSQTVEAVVLPVVSVAATLTPGDVDDAVARSRLWLSAPVTLRSEDGEKTISWSPEEMAVALTTESLGDRLTLSFDPAKIAPVLERNRGDVEQPPVDARFEVDGNDVRIIPGRSGTVIDPDATSEALALAAGSATRSAILPVIEGAVPDTTTADLEALSVSHLVSQFTTYHDCCQNRVVNIHLMADAVDGVIVAPGATFSLNDHVGPRTEEDGYLEDGAIVAGELTKTVGGGVSQFATTFYNAVFWGGYEDVDHKPHSLYFSRYPEGIEATISWPAPELIFRNNTESGVLIDTSYTDTSITVRFFGENDGRSVALAYPGGGPLQQEVVSEGGPDARIVSAVVSDRYAQRDPGTPLYRANADLEVDSEVVVQSPGGGWSVLVQRTVTVGGSQDTREWTVVYSPRREIIEVHPCMVPDTEEECPIPTTTTTQAPATTVAVSPPAT